ncbi:MAG: Gfo/Idh/MocA family oxidoreductase [Marinosulfonomonas sp.]|nr:Gfo/Idh/MocA family oxidoreductase [Marinosulfonomonas sp.]
MNKDIGVALIGTGFMGKAHALAWRAVQPVFATESRPRLEVLCDQPAERAAEMAGQFGFARATDDWRAAIFDPDVDVVSITTPNKLHAQMVIAAAEAGKHIWCEKPLAVTLDDAKAMAKAVQDASVAAVIGYNYTQNPTFLHAVELVTSGVIGRPIHFRGFVDEDYQADPDTPWTWRSLRSEAGLGVLGDLTCHLISMALRLMGPVSVVNADMQTVHHTRPLEEGKGEAKVENEDVASALLRFENGAQGVISSSRVAWGRKNRLSFEVHGDKGMICYDQERMNELQLYVADGPKSRQGFKTILTGPEHPHYARFNPAPGHTLGFQDQKTIEAAAFLDMIAGRDSSGVGMTEALKIEETIHAIANAAKEE